MDSNFHLDRLKYTEKILIVVLGPTAVGKSEIGIQIAKELNGEIINFDSMQVYKGFDIGTAKVPPEKRENIPHHLIDILDKCEQFSAADFAKHAYSILKEIIERNKIPILVGGTGLYLRALLNGIFPGPGRDEDVREEIMREIEEFGTEKMWENLNKVDSEYAKRIDKNDKIRIIRGLEIFRLTGIPISAHFKNTRSLVEDWKKIKVGVIMKKKKLYQKINERSEKMFFSGLLEEIKKLMLKGIDENCPLFQALGYKWALKSLKGEISVEEAVRLTQRDTRHYAKRQLTWFKKEKGVHWFLPEDKEKIIEFIKKEIEWRKQS
ncbi:MAG: tRNA (adenosine(37)-N6)-dimethylallyltransferase MiaA [Acidobacteriota bacterium]